MSPSRRSHRRGDPVWSPFAGNLKLHFKKNKKSHIPIYKVYGFFMERRYGNDNYKNVKGIY
jgi:hypothetical protein